MEYKVYKEYTDERGGKTIILVPVQESARKEREFERFLAELIIRDHKRSAQKKKHQ